MFIVFLGRVVYLLNVLLYLAVLMEKKRLEKNIFN